MPSLDPFKGTLPYATELRGVYQPLLGWRARSAKARVTRSTVGRTTAIATALARDRRFATPPDWRPWDLSVPTAPLGDGPANAVTSMVANLAQGLAGPSTPPTAEQWRSLLTPEALQQMVQRAVNRLPPGDVAGGPGGAVDREAAGRAYLATASLLGHLANTDVNALNAVVFSPALDWEHLLANDVFAAFPRRVLEAVLSPVGLLHVYRQYFYEFDSFLGPPVGHVWLSPGSTVELVEVNVRRTLVERVVEASQETVTRSETTTTTQEELSDAVKQENAESFKFGASARGGFNVLVAHGEASASFDLETSRKTASETTHKQSRQQSEKLSAEIRRNFKTTFRTLTESTDTASRRYVLQNTSAALVNYELRRKLRRVGVQLQHIATQLCWQHYVDDPGQHLAISSLVHVAKPGDQEPEQPHPEEPAPLAPVELPFTAPLEFIVLSGQHSNAPNTTYLDGWSTNDFGNVTNEVRIAHSQTRSYRPPAGMALADAVLAGPVAKVIPERDFPNPITLSAKVTDAEKGEFQITAQEVNFRGQPYIPVPVKLRFVETQVNWNGRKAAYDQQRVEYKASKARAQHEAYVNAVRERLKLAGEVKVRAFQDLREEERHVVFRRILKELTHGSGSDKHVTAELIRQIFDVDSMMYFVAPDWWEPREVVLDRLGAPSTAALTESDRVGWGGPREAQFEKYLVTEESKPAPLGASLGWVLQLDGDNLRNAFLNAAWVKAVLPIRPAREAQALDWLRHHTIEGSQGLDASYQSQPDDPPEFAGKTIGEVLGLLSAEVAALHEKSRQTDPTSGALPTETVFEFGFDPLQGGVRVGAEALEVFDQWLEVLPTDQVVAVDYPPKP